MALTMGQVPVTGTVAAFAVPPGPVAVTMYAASAGVYVGAGTPLTTGNGMAVSTSPFGFRTFPGSQGATLFASVGTAATTIALFYLVSTAR